jgi:hypothetical protein
MTNNYYPEYINSSNFMRKTKTQFKNEPSAKGKEKKTIFK